MTGSLETGRRSCAGWLRTTALFIGCLGAELALAAPYVPAADAVILEHVPARSALERLAPLRASVSAHPGDLAVALALAQGYIAIGRRNGDPRFVAYAEATLQPWVERPEPPAAALVLQATALQYLHQFDAALALLDRATGLAPLDSQAWLTRAALLELRGNYPDARRACARLVRSVDQLIALTCLESVDGRSGRLGASYANLRALGVTDPRLPPDVRSWALSVRAEMAERLGDDAQAEADLAVALGITPDDPVLKAALADVLLRRNRPAEVVALLRDGEAQDALLLRLAIAGKRAVDQAAPRWAMLYAERVRAAERDRDSTHLREQAMFLLEVAGDAREALRAAARNWQAQREPADARVYAAAAVRAGSEPDRLAIQRWIASSHYEDRVLSGIVAATAPGAP